MMGQAVPGDQRQTQVLENAVESFLKECEKEIKERHHQKACELLDRAEKRFPQLDPIALAKWRPRLEALKIRILLLDLFPQTPNPNRQRFKIFSRDTVRPAVYDCNYDLCHLIREKVFCAELRIPYFIEFEQKLEDKAFHALVLVGDAPYTYSRVWIQDTPEGNKWAVLDRMCTLDVDKDQPYKHRGHGAANYMLECIKQFLAVNLLPNPNYHCNILVVHVPVKTPKVIEKLINKGFRFVTSLEDYKNLVERGDVPITYFHDGKVRVNTVHLYIPLPVDYSLLVNQFALANNKEISNGSPEYQEALEIVTNQHQKACEADLLQIQQYARVEMARAANPDNIKKAKEELQQFQLRQQERFQHTINQQQQYQQQLAQQHQNQQTPPPSSN